MVKFLQSFQRSTRFYQFTYHLHKATYKGLSQFYRTYAKIEKSYSEQLIRLSKNIWTDMTDLRKQNPTVISTVKQMLSCLQTTSQLHFNYGEKLQQICSFYNSEYNTSKRKKQNQMKIIRDRNQQQYTKCKEKQKNNRPAIDSKQRQICKALYTGLNKLAEDENDRIQKIKQQSIIYFSVYRKICEKQLDRVSELSQKLVKQQFHVDNKRIKQISEQLRVKHNQYGQEQIQKRNSYDINQTMTFNRQSLRASLLVRNRATKINDYQSNLKQKVQKYNQMADQIVFVCMDDTDYAIFDSSYFANRSEVHKYSRQINGECIRAISYEMFDSYVKIYQEDSDALLLLQMIKAKLKVKISDKIIFQAKNVQQFWDQVSNKDYEYRWHARFLQLLSEMYEKKISKTQLNQHIKKRIKRDDFSVAKNLNLSFLSVASLINLLLDPIFTINIGEQFLNESYIDFLVLIAKFGEKFLNIQRNIVVLLFLKKLFRLISSVPRNFSEPLDLIMNDPYLMEHKILDKSPQKIMNVTQWSNSLLNKVTQKLIYFFTCKTPFINYIKILLLIQKLQLRKQQHLNAKQHIYVSLRSAGYSYFKSIQSSNQVLEAGQITGSLGGQDRLKRLTLVLEQLDYQNFMTQHFQSAAKQISKLFGVSEKISRAKLFEQFTYSVLQIIEDNLLMISQEQGIDRQGYALRLGVIFAKIDLMNPVPVTQYDSYFNVLDKYLVATQKDYDSLLQQSRRTQLWIMQQNALATTNCIDFCSLLYKPFEFLLISLKKLQDSQQTQYIRKYSQFIRLRLNKDLKTQIIKYITFLYESMDNYRNQPPELKLKPKRREKPHQLSKQSMEQDRNSFKEITRRMFNLLFLKDQLQEMMRDFLDEDIYKKLQYSIFHVHLIQKYSTQYPDHRKILNNIQQIVESVLSYEQKIVKRVANVAVFHYFRPMFENLYFQQQKNVLEQFFSSQPVKLSDYTLLRMQQILQEWFTIIAKNLPDQFIDSFSEQFANAFFLALRNEVLNPNKFKLPIAPLKVVPYLQKDVGYMIKMIKQKFFSAEIIEKKIQRPFENILNDLDSQTTKLTGAFQNATLKNNEQKRRYYLSVLNLRVKDQKALQFVKNYKPKEFK